MKLFVMSDTHANTMYLIKALPLINACDYVVHLGDGVGDLMCIAQSITAKIVRVRGNCDFGDTYPKHTILKLGNESVLITHGDAYNVKNTLTLLLDAAKANGCSLALYGHTHVAKTDAVSGVTLLNPGTLGAKGGKKASYAVIEEKEGRIFTKIEYI